MKKPVNGGAYPDVGRIFFKTMLTNKELETRRPIWTELSDFYLDTELSDDDLKRKADVFRSSGLTLDEIKEINYGEVGPHLIDNLRSTAGIWNGFDEEWLHSTIERHITRQRGRPRNIFQRVRNYFNKRAIDYYTGRYFISIEGHLIDGKTSTQQ
ncbi:MAG: hypothetical protein JSS79_15860 [Bacteroidetes bacterium]|nr:hypothetical protein [Bacteroidota bacterium]